MPVSTHTISGIELFDVKHINRATIADGNLLNTYVYEPLIQNEDILASAVGSAYNAIADINHTLQDKKDKQDVISLSGSATKTIKNITQNANGEMNVEFQDIDLPPEVPNVELISTDESISISATSAGNDVTYDLSINDIAGANNYAFLQSEMPVNVEQMALEYTNISTSGIHWNTIDQRLEFGDNIKLVDLNYNIEYEIDTANGVAYDDLILYIYSDGQLLDQETFSIDTSKAKHTCKFNKKILDPSNLQFLVKVPKAGDIDARIEINDETFKSIAGGGGSSGTTYYAGLNIEISDNVIIGRDWTPELNAKLDTSAFVLPNSAIWDNTYNTVLANSATWNEGGSSGIEDVTTSGSYLRTSAGWTEYNEPDPCTLCGENFVEWNFNRQSTDTMVAYPLLALSDTSGTPSGTLHAGDKYMLYVDGLLGQSASNNTYVNFGIQAGTTTGQYLLSEPLPSRKLCRSTSTGNDFACAFMFTVPTNGSYSVAVAPHENNQEYKFFGNTTVRQIKIG